MNERRSSVYSSSSSNASSPIEGGTGPFGLYAGGGDTSVENSPVALATSDSHANLFKLRHSNSFNTFGSLQEPIGSPELRDADQLSVVTEASRKGDKKPRSHNFAGFGAKITDAANHAKIKTKESSPGQSLLKAKMFRQSKPDLKSLRMKTDLGISAARSSMERSPMTRTSKQLDRIAALGSPATASLATPNKHLHHHHHHHHITFRKTQSPASILSSSASNSKLANEGSLYSFHGTGGTLNFQLEAFKGRDDRDHYMTTSWELILAQAQAIFTNDLQRRIPIEDFNLLVSMHFSAHLMANYTALEWMDKLQELLLYGMRCLATLSNYSGAELLVQTANSWEKFFTKLLPRLEAVFLPVQLEIEGVTELIRSPDAAQEYWDPLTRKYGQISIRKCILVAYRDTMIQPVLGALSKALLDSGSFDSLLGEQTSTTAARITQCANTLARIRSNDSIQTSFDDFLLTIRQSWVATPRVAKDRRGLVL